MKLNDIIKIKGVIQLLSGLHVGAGELEMRIGGTDNPVVTHPYTGEPYIPGSSIKGKVRSLLEMKSGLMGRTNGKPLGAAILSKLNGAERLTALTILQLFGTSGADGDLAKEVGPARASFSDCFIKEESRKNTIANQLPFTEVKAENSINRITGTADNPRFTERAIAGLEFDLIISLKIIEGDDNLSDLLLEGLKLLEHDALGGSGSRGYGRIRLSFYNTEYQQRFNQTLIS